MEYSCSIVWRQPCSRSPSSALAVKNSAGWSLLVQCPLLPAMHFGISAFCWGTTTVTMYGTNAIIFSPRVSFLASCIKSTVAAPALSCDSHGLLMLSSCFEKHTFFFLQGSNLCVGTPGAVCSLSCTSSLNTCIFFLLICCLASGVQLMAHLDLPGVPAAHTDDVITFSSSSNISDSGDDSFNVKTWVSIALFLVTCT